MFLPDNKSVTLHHIVRLRQQCLSVDTQAINFNIIMPTMFMTSKQVPSSLRERERDYNALASQQV